jgi:hypothetical protein
MLCPAFRVREGPIADIRNPIAAMVLAYQVEPRQFTPDRLRLPGCAARVKMRRSPASLM